MMTKTKRSGAELKTLYIPGSLVDHKCFTKILETRYVYYTLT